MVRELSSEFPESISMLTLAGAPLDPTAILSAKKPAIKSTWQEYFDSVASEWARNRPRSTPSPPAARPTSSGQHKSKWTPEEDTVLAAAIRMHGTASWRSVAEDVPGRSGKQCRERWLGHMAPDVNRDAWSPAEDVVLISKHRECGSHWAKIRQSLPGRSTSSVKNRWKWLCRRDVPNHWQEFQALTKGFEGTEQATGQGQQEFDMELPGLVPDGDALRSRSLEIWGNCAWTENDGLGLNL
jgi:hypothetical protein